MPAWFLGRGQLIERTIVSPAHHLAPFSSSRTSIIALQHVKGSFGEVEHFLTLSDLDIIQIGTDRCSHVAGQGPGGGGPDQQGFFSLPRSGKRRVTLRWVSSAYPSVTISCWLIAGGAARAPGHHVRAPIQPAFLPAFLQEGPDHVVIFVGEGEVAAAQFRQS